MDHQQNISINPFPSKSILSQNELDQLEDSKMHPFAQKLSNLHSGSTPNLEQSSHMISSHQQIPLGENERITQAIPVKDSTRKKKIIIFAVIVAAAILITGGVLIYHFVSQSENNNTEKTIKMPQDYEKYKETIQKGQENNLVEIIHVPKSQKIYEYTMYNNQTTVQADGQTQENSSKIVHTFGLLCTGLNDKEFQMILYLMDTKTYDNNKLISSISGFPEMLNKENKKLRMMEEAAQNANTSEQTQQRTNSMEDIEKNSDNIMMNEYAPLNPDEIKMLEEKGITKKMFDFSHYPIIKFSIFKDGKINMIEQPINLRNDFYAIYLNVLEQVSPLVAKDKYTMITKDGRRILSKNGGKMKGRSLANEEVDKELTAQEQDNGDMSLNQKFETLKTPSETQSQTSSYDQSSMIQNGSLLESKVKSDVSMSDNMSVDPEDQNGMPLMKKIEVKSEGLIKFVKQEDTVDTNLFNTIVEYQDEMTVINQNFQQLLELYNTVFNTNESKGKAIIEKDPEDLQNPNSGRMLVLDQGTTMGQIINKPIFRKSFASFEFGADVRSQCKQYKGIAAKDLCTVGLYSYFNGATIKLAEKQTSINVSKILKMYQIIQNFVQSKLTNIKDDILGNLTKIKEDLDGILDKLEEFIDVRKNPVLKEIYEIVYNDELQVFTLINTFETFMNRAVTTLSNIVADPFQAIKEQTLSFITFKKNSIESSANSIQNFYVSKFTLIKNAVSSQQSINQEDYDDIKSVIDNIDDLLAILIDKPAQNVFNDLETYVLEQSNKVFGETSTIEKSIDVPQDDSKVEQDASSNNTTDTKNNSATQNNNNSNSTSKTTNSASTDTKNNSATQNNNNSNSTSKTTNSTSTDNQAKSQQKPNLLKRALGTSTFVETLQKYLLKAMNTISQVKDFSGLATDGLKKNVKNLAKEVLEIIEKLPKTSPQRSTDVLNSLEEFENIFDYSLDITAGLVEVKEEIDKIFKTIILIQTKQTAKIIENIAGNLTGFPIELLSKLKSQGQLTVAKFKGVVVNMKNNLIQWKNELVEHSRKLLVDAKLLFQGLKNFFSKVEFDENDQDNYNQPIVSEVQDIIASVEGILNFNAGGIVGTAKRFLQIPNKFSAFLVDIKDLGDIGLSIQGIYLDQKELWQNFGQKPQEQAQVYNNQLQSSVENDVEQDQQKALLELNASAETMVGKDLAVYQSSILDENKSTGQKVKEIIFEMIKQADFEGRVETPPLVIPFEYTYVYPTPIGILLKFRLYASWDALLFFEVKVKDAKLDLGVGVQTKVVIGGEVSASAVVVEVGGYAEGTFLNTELKLGLILKVLENFHGSVYLKAKFIPFSIKMGLFYKTIFQIEKLTCKEEDEERRRMLGFWDWISNAVKTVVQAVAKAVDVIVKVVKKIIKCLSTLEIGFKRNDIFPPLEFTGTVYNITIFEAEF